ncbi:hypothetical protein LJC60_11205, partial [Ruminococcaceae bacterium OttesenSCG-928-D13]|nr:hypothetical protein [Ruminococcaceae bacterium OttesenSCG-928-D13]
LRPKRHVPKLTGPQVLYDTRLIKKAIPMHTSIGIALRHASLAPKCAHTIGVHQADRWRFNARNRKMSKILNKNLTALARNGILTLFITQDCV